MDKSMKIILLILFLVLTLSCSVYAAETKIVVSDAATEPGSSVTFQVSIKNNPGFMCGKGIITYDPAVFQLTDIVTDGHLFESAVINVERGVVSFASTTPIEGEDILFEAELFTKEAVPYGEYEVLIAVEEMHDPLGERLYFDDCAAVIAVVDDVAAYALTEDDAAQSEQTPAGENNAQSGSMYDQGTAMENESQAASEADDSSWWLFTQRDPYDPFADKADSDAMVRLWVLLFSLAVLVVLLVIKIIIFKK